MVFRDFVSQLEEHIRQGNRFGFYKIPNGLDVGGKRMFHSLYVEGEKGRLLRDDDLT